MLNDAPTHAWSRIGESIVLCVARGPGRTVLAVEAVRRHLQALPSCQCSDMLDAMTGPTRSVLRFVVLLALAGALYVFIYTVVPWIMRGAFGRFIPLP